MNRLERSRARGLTVLALAAFLILLGGQLSTPAAAASSLEETGQVLFIGEQQVWISWDAKELRTLSAPVMPAFYFNLDDELSVFKAPVSEEGYFAGIEEVVFGGECSGGTCMRGGTTLTCPSSGTSCSAEQVCACTCIELPGGSISAAHQCEELAPF